MFRIKAWDLLSLLYSSCTREEKPFKQMQLGSNIILVTVASSGPVLDSKMASVVLYYQEKYVQRSSRGAQPRPAPQLDCVVCARLCRALHFTWPPRPSPTAPAPTAPFCGQRRSAAAATLQLQLMACCPGLARGAQPRSASQLDCVVCARL